MFSYNKFLEYPIKIKNPNPRLANIVITQYGGAYCKCLSNLANAGQSLILCKPQIWLQNDNII